MLYEMKVGFIWRVCEALLLSFCVCGSVRGADEGVGKMPHKLPEGVHPASVFVSPDASRFGYLVKRGLRVVPVIDGMEGQAVDWIAENQVSFSPDGRHTLFVAKKGQKAMVVHDGA